MLDADAVRYASFELFDEGSVVRQPSAVEHVGDSGKKGSPVPEVRPADVQALREHWGRPENS
jgi:hypothetical protein